MCEVLLLEISAHAQPPFEVGVYYRNYILYTVKTDNIRGCKISGFYHCHEISHIRDFPCVYNKSVLQTKRTDVLC